MALYAKKSNRVVSVDEQSKAFYLKQGYDIINEKREVIEYSPKSTVNQQEHAKVVKELEELKAKIAGTEQGVNIAEMTVDELLTAYAKEKGIDVGNASSADGILKKIKEAEVE